MTGKTSTVFSQLDIANSVTEELLKPFYIPHFKDLQFYREFNKSVQSGQFSKSESFKKLHYMTEFYKLFSKILAEEKMSLLWGLKTLFSEFTSVFISKTNHCDFLGYLSLVMNFSGYLQAVRLFLSDDVFFDTEVAKIEEIIFLK